MSIRSTMAGYEVGDSPVPGLILEQRLASGSFGTVWRAVAPGGTHIAVKIVDLRRSCNLKELRSLKLIRNIRHANIVPLIGFWIRCENGLVADGDELLLDYERKSANGTAVCTTELARPQQLIVGMGLGDMSLQDRLRECYDAGLSGIPVLELLGVMDDVARAVDFLNQKRHVVSNTDLPVAIQHCDIKPQNILLVGGAAQLCDLGLARVLDDTRATRMGFTAAYGAPECVSGSSPSPGTDQYSLAISYYELRTGQLPFGESASPASVIAAHLQGHLDLSALPEPERLVIQRATALNPEHRYRTTQEMVKALRNAVATENAHVAKLQVHKNKTNTNKIVWNAKRDRSRTTANPHTMSTLTQKTAWLVRSPWSWFGMLMVPLVLITVIALFDWGSPPPSPRSVVAAMPTPPILPVAPVTHPAVDPIDEPMQPSAVGTVPPTNVALTPPKTDEVPTDKARPLVPMEDRIKADPPLAIPLARGPDAAWVYASLVAMRDRLTRMSVESAGDLTRYLSACGTYREAWMTRMAHHCTNEAARSLDSRRLTEAEEWLLLAKGLGVDSPYWHLQNGRQLAQHGDLQSAIEEYTQAMNGSDDRDSLRGTMLRFRGILYAKVAEPTKAIDDLTQALQLDPSDIGALRMRALVHLTQSNYELALKYQQRLRELAPRATFVLPLRVSREGVSVTADSVAIPIPMHAPLELIGVNDISASVTLDGDKGRLIATVPRTDVRAGINLNTP
ncbi:MAG: protein kinase [Planctomycetota bacterium]|nr:protein kinase [Planctomycetota bacterium]